MLNLFCGFDSREEIGYHVFCSSVIERTTLPVSFVPLSHKGFKQGTNQFTISRFAVPWLMGFKGKAIFMDASDMLIRCDIAEYAAQLEKLDKAVALVQHNYKTRHKIKYIATELESPNVDYDRKNWASMMLINCEHAAWRAVTPEKINSMSFTDLLQLKFIADEDIVPMEQKWNVLADEGQETKGAKLLHWTAGIPGFEHYKNAPEADLWRAQWMYMKYPLRT